MVLGLEGDTTTVLALSALKIITVALGFLIVYLALKSYRVSRRRPILLLGIGIGIMTLGAISEGVAFQGLDWNLEQSHLFEAVMTLAGFGVLVYSLYAK